MRHPQRHSALADRRIARAGQVLLHLFHRLDHRRHDRASAHVEGQRHLVGVLGRQADDGRQVRRLQVAQRALQLVERDAAVLQVEQHEVAACLLQDVADARRGKLDQEGAELHLPLLPGHLADRRHLPPHFHRTE